MKNAQLFFTLIGLLFLSCNSKEGKKNTPELTDNDTITMPETRKSLPYVPEVYQESVATIQSLKEKNEELTRQISIIQQDTLPQPVKEAKIGSLRIGILINLDRIAKLEEETICGLMNESKDVELYDGSLGVTRDFVKMHEKSVGQLQWRYNFGDEYNKPGNSPGNVRGVRWCTGSLISNNLFLTAGHCFDEEANGWILPSKKGSIISSWDIAKLMRVNFNFQIDATTGKVRTDTIDFPVEELIEYREGMLDYALVRLGRNKEGKLPGEIFGFLTPSNDDVAINTMTAIIQHPQGQPKVIEAGPVGLINLDVLGYYETDTEGGSSGAAVLSSITGKIVGVHVRGGCDRAGRFFNAATPMQRIISTSKILKEILGIN